jgi:folate-dependent phosphoribosylglycinamide formyltransferase PurN/GNAT superfamily N-acetyltransferase
MAVTLEADLADARFGPDAHARAHALADMAGYVIHEAVMPDETLAAWIDLTFAPSWWSAEMLAGRAWYALATDGSIAGFAAYGAREFALPWLGRYRGERAVGIFGPFGIAPEHRKTGLGEALLIAALASLRELGYARAAIPAVSGESLVAMYETRTGARIVDTYDYASPRRFRTTMLASGSGSNVQNIIDVVAAGVLPLDLVRIVCNNANAFVMQRALRSDIPAHVAEWERDVETRAAYDERVIDDVAASEPDLVLLLGWMHLLPAAFLARFPHVLNTHPSFLPHDPRADATRAPDGTAVPAFRGARAIEAALAAGASWSGISVHRVTPETDRGEILVRTPLAILPGEDVETLTQRLRPVEYAAVPAAIRRWIFEQDARFIHN